MTNHTKSQSGCCGGDAVHKPREHSHGALAGPTVGVIDPVCGMTVDPKTAEHRADYKGQAYFFCSGRCKAKFQANPMKYLDVSAKTVQSAVESAIYTCPMHPEIRKVGPGSCPICGMALEPLLAAADAGPNPELIDMTRRFWIGLMVTLPVLALEMGGHLTNLHMLLGKQTSNWLQFLLATPVVLWAGWPFFVLFCTSYFAKNSYEETACV